MRVLRWVASATVCCALALLGNEARAAICDGLGESDRATYIALGEEAAEEYSAGNYIEAIKAMLDAMALCDEDPRTQYNLARAYHKANDCNMALFWYEQVQDMEAVGELADAIKSQQKKAGRYQTELMVQCANSARVTIECGQSGVVVTIGEATPQACPFDGRLDAGVYKIQATLIGYEPYLAELTLLAGQNNRLLVPELKRPTVEATTGALQVTCPPGAENVQLRGPGYDEVISCPVSRELAPGSYTVALPGEVAQTLEIEAGGSYSVQLSRSEVPEESSGFVIGVRISSGLGLASGTLYRENNSDEFGKELDGLQPTLPGLALVNEFGFAFNDALALMAQSRLEFGNLSVIGLALLRWTFLSGGLFAARLDVGVGGGVLARAVEVEDGQRPLSRMGPAIGVVGLGSTLAITRLLSLVFDVRTHAGFPDLGLQFDLDAGFEVRF